MNILPISSIETVPAGNWRKERFKAYINFSWITENGLISKAPHAKLILYPKYPEVRFSGFLKGSREAPSFLMNQRLPNRVLFISINIQGEILGYVSHPESQIAKEFDEEKELEKHGVFHVINISQRKDSKYVLLQQLKRIHQLDWITAKRLDKHGNIVPCKSSNCGGYTLEAELGITPNGYSKPDFLGWEIKQFRVNKLNKLGSSIITLMTPEPTGGIYQKYGVEYFVRKYGYIDRMGRPDRMNFGGIHRYGIENKSTKLKLQLIGFDVDNGKIRNSDGRIVLIDKKDEEVASWSFSSLLLHWNRKHNKACYVPCLMKTNGIKKYKYGNKVILCTGTDFQLFLSQITRGNIYYDPGIKLENLSDKPKVKRRNQFRIKSLYIPDIYKHSYIIDLDDNSFND